MNFLTLTPSDETISDEKSNSELYLKGKEAGRTKGTKGRIVYCCSVTTTQTDSNKKYLLKREREREKAKKSGCLAFITLPITLTLIIIMCSSHISLLVS
jgi:hypothetical protein